MGTVTVQTQYGSVNFKIAGDRPTVQERLKIDRVLANPTVFLPPEVVKRGAERRAGMFEGFDYTTGVQDAGLRAALSLAEKPEEEVTQLARFGLSEGDYTRDPRGRLALTPRGAAKLNIGTDKNIVIDESGFSSSDLADLAGLVPEVGGAIGGAIAGQAAIPVPILGAMVGAAIGGGGGNLVEEAIEAATGTSKQTAGEILTDTLKEAAIAGAGEGIVGLVAKGFGVALRGAAPRGLSDDQLRTIGESREMFGITPAAGLAGANALLARAQATSEQIFRGSPRTLRNNEAIIRELDNLRATAGTSDPVELGRVLLEAAKTANTTVTQAEKEAGRAVIRGLEDIANDLGRATKRNQFIDDDLYQAFFNSYKGFEDLAETKFAKIDEAIKDVAGNAEVIPIGNVARQAQAGLRQFEGSVPSGTIGDTISMLRGVAALKPSSSFTQIYNARKSLNDFMMSNPGSVTVQTYGAPLLSQIDAVLNASNVENALLSSGRSLDSAGIAKVRSAAQSLGEAREFYREGMKKFEEIANVANLSGIRNEIRNGVRVNPANMMDRLVKPNNPELIRRAEEVLRGIEVEGQTFPELKRAIAGEWLRRAMASSFSDIDPVKFRGTIFRDKLEKLGTTADELFDYKVGGVPAVEEIRRLANQMAATSLSKVDESLINAVDQFTGPFDMGTSVSLLRNVANAQKEAQEVRASALIQKLNRTGVTEMEAAELIANSGTKPEAINRLMKYFADQDQAKQKIRGYYMENLIGDFGDNFLTDPAQLKAFGKRLEGEFSSGKLSALFGDELAERMNKFGRVLVFNSKTVDGGGLVAANVAVSPLQNLGKLAKYSVIGRLLSSDLFYRNLDKQYKALTAGTSGPQKAAVLGQLIAQGLSSLIAQTTTQSLDAGITEAARQGTAMVENYNQQRQAQEAQRRAATPVPQVTPGAIPQPMAMPGPRMNAQPNIREQAAQNPAVAASLLGGLGSAALLNR